MIDRHLAVASVAEAEGRLADALRAYRDVLREAPNEVDALVGVGRITFALGDQPTALEYFTAALVRAPDSVEALHGRALVFHDEGLSEQALADLNRAVVMRPRAVDARLSRVLVALDLERNELARADLYILNQAAPNDPDIALAWAQSLSRSKPGRGASAAGRELSALSAHLAGAFVDDPLLTLLRGAAAGLLDDLHQARVLVLEALEREPELAEELMRIPVLATILEAAPGVSQGARDDSGEE